METQSISDECYFSLCDYMLTINLCIDVRHSSCGSVIPIACTTRSTTFWKKTFFCSFASFYSHFRHAFFSFFSVFLSLARSFALHSLTHSRAHSQMLKKHGKNAIKILCLMLFSFVRVFFFNFVCCFFFALLPFCVRSVVGIPCIHRCLPLPLFDIQFIWRCLRPESILPFPPRFHVHHTRSNQTKTKEKKFTFFHNQQCSLHPLFQQFRYYFHSSIKSDRENKRIVSTLCSFDCETIVEFLYCQFNLVTQTIFTASLFVMKTCRTGTMARAKACALATVRKMNEEQEQQKKKKIIYLTKRDS